MQLTLASALLVGPAGVCAGAVVAWSLRSGWHRRAPHLGRLPAGSLLTLPAVVAIGWILAAMSVGEDAAAPAALLFVVLAAGLTWIDLDAHRLPDQLVLGGTLAVAALLVAAAAASGRWQQLGVAAAAAVLLAAVFLALAVVGSMGLGDVKLAGLVGLVLGWFGWGTVLTGVVVAFGGAAVVGVALLAAGRRRWSTHIAFGPALALGAVVALIVAPHLT